MRTTRNYRNAVENFIRDVHNRPAFQNILTILRTNKAGRVWLVGGTIYRTLARFLYGKLPQLNGDPDYDLTYTNKLPHKLSLPSCWTFEPKPNHTPEPFDPYDKDRLTNGKAKADLIHLEEWWIFDKLGCAPTLESYLDTVPLDIQAIAYDPVDRVFHDAGCRDALESRTVRIRCPQNAAIAAQRAILPNAHAYAELKARSLGFTVYQPLKRVS